MFSSLTEEDLQVLGITAFGPRKKLLMAINFLSTHHHSHGHLSPQIYHHHPPYNQYMQHAAAMGGRMSHGPQINTPPGIPAGFEQKIQQQQQQQQNAQGNGAVGGSTSGSGGGGQNPVQGSGQGNPEQSNKNTSPPGSGGGGGAGGGQDGAGNVPPKFSGSAAPGAERRTSNSS